VQSLWSAISYPVVSSGYVARSWSAWQICKYIFSISRIGQDWSRISCLGSFQAQMRIRGPNISSFAILHQFLGVMYRQFRATGEKSSSILKRYLDAHSGSIRHDYWKRYSLKHLIKFYYQLPILLCEQWQFLDWKPLDTHSFPQKQTVHPVSVVFQLYNKNSGRHRRGGTYKAFKFFLGGKPDGYTTRYFLENGRRIRQASCDDLTSYVVSKR
jgi:hypothetical protein